MMMMCRLNHLLAADGTISWPECGLKRTDPREFSGSAIPHRNHQVAVTANSESSDGRNWELATSD